MREIRGECIDRKGEKKERKREKRFGKERMTSDTRIEEQGGETRRFTGDTYKYLELASFHTPPLLLDTGASKLQFFLGHSVN